MGVGPGADTPFLLATLPAGTPGSALELTVEAHSPVVVGDLAVLGGSGGPPARVG